MTPIRSSILSVTWTCKVEQPGEVQKFLFGESLKFLPEGEGRFSELYVERVVIEIAIYPGEAMGTAQRVANLKLFDSDRSHPAASKVI